MEFPFPYEPYPIQKEFMKELYSTLENNCIGIFESPTGTGKSLSIICSSMFWLKNNLLIDSESKQKVLTNSTDESLSSSQDQEESIHSIPNWMKKQYEESKKKRKLQLEEEKQEKLKKERKRLNEIRTLMQGEERPNKKLKLNSSTSKSISNLLSETEILSKLGDDEEFLLEDYESDEEDLSKENKENPSEAILRKILQESDEENEASSIQSEENNTRKIYYCSRTHSQLSQFIHEFEKTKFMEDSKVVTLGGRSLLCINDTVLNLKMANKINDKCLDMQKSETRGSSCLYYSQLGQIQFRDRILAKIQDIEDYVKMGKRLNLCPYYGTRSAISSAELIALPYNMLLHKDTRESLGIKLEGNIVIIDEAHNLIEAINNMYSIELQFSHMNRGHSQLSQYLEKYKNRLKAKNIRYIKQLLFLLQSLIKSFTTIFDSNQSNNNAEVLEATKYSAPIDTQHLSRIMTINDFQFTLRIDNINLFKIEKFFKRSDIVRKVNGFSEKLISELQVSEGEWVEKHVPSLGMVESFLLALTNADKDGRILVTKNGNKMSSSLKFLLLNPERHFTEVLQQARAVILAGGTMQPTSDLIEQLVSNKVPREKIRLFSCGHIIPPENLTTICLSSGPSGLPFDFTFKNRSNTQLMEELGRTILNLSNIVPDGMICFFPSYSYEEQIYQHWQTKGIIQQIEKKKKFFREPKNASQVDQILNQYQETIENNFESNSPYKGALLSCVVGGKMSEGINFGDGLGRCVVMVGLPFSNPFDPFLVEKMEYIKSKGISSQSFYEELCMKAVNQSIGRVIRHSRDYATIVLLDCRYQQDHIIQKLPHWINQTTNKQETFGKAFACLTQFYQKKKSSQQEIENKRKEKNCK